MSVAASSVAAPPILPLLSWRELVPAKRFSGVGVFDVGSPLLLNSGTAAIRAALQIAGVGSGHNVLVPAFNCPSMVDAVAAAGANARFYRVDETLSIRVEHLAERCDSTTRAVLVPHLFHRVQDLRPIRAYCDEQRLTLIEDCAHTLFGSIDGSPIGSLGHFAIASPRKFLPLAEGGLLTSATQRLALSAEWLQPSPARAARVMFDGIDASVRFGRMRLLAPIVLGVKQLSRLARGTAAKGGTTDTLRDAGSSGSPVSVVHAALPTRTLVRGTRTQAAMNRRGENFEYLLRGIASLSGARVLVSSDSRSRDTVPYMLPVLLEEPCRQFAALKRLGVPMWRWEYSQRGQCPVADRYAEALVQLPCHQSLDRAELDWLLDRIESGLR